MADMWQQSKQWILDHREPCSNIVIAVIVAGCAIAAWASGPAVTPSHAASPKSCLKLGHATGHRTSSHPVKVRNATDTLTIYVGRDGDEVRRETNPLAIQNDGRLAGGTVLCTIASDFVRSDGLILSANQVMSQAIVSNNGLSVTIRVQVAPRAGLVSGFGSYSGMVRLDDSRASGAEVPVRIYIEYPYINRVLLCGLLLASAGLIWGLLVRIADKDLKYGSKDEPFFANLALRVAVLATAVPIVNAQVLSNPGWTGTLSQYIKLGGLVGAAAIAATPSLRAIVSRMRPKTPDADLTGASSG
jgi:hypothetical protein